jgi:hypothetical protein
VGLPPLTRLEGAGSRMAVTTADLCDVVVGTQIKNLGGSGNYKDGV